VKSESVILELQRATHAVLHLLASALVDLDLTASETNALGNLGDGKARTVSELGAAMGTRPATLTGILDRLERRTLITRGARPGDRRAVFIELTADGVQVAGIIRRAMRDLEKQALAGVPPDAVAGARVVLKALTAASG
jgi:MarR family transcriptional regulator, organic hydroperoxide resistance regulator